jgi:hypothetical protein
VTVLVRWLAGLQYNAVRRIETPSLLTTVVQADGRPLRGVLLADDLCLTRQRTFYQITDGKATPISHDDVAAKYDVEKLQQDYRKLQDQWKHAHHIQ